MKLVQVAALRLTPNHWSRAELVGPEEEPPELESNRALLKEPGLSKMVSVPFPFHGQQLDLDWNQDQHMKLQRVPNHFGNHQQVM